MSIQFEICGYKWGPGSVSIDPSTVERWLKDEGVFSNPQPQEGMLAQWGIKVPIDIQQSINLSVAIPKGKEDQVVVSLTLIPGSEAQEIFRSLTEDKKRELARELGEEFLRTRDLLPIFGQQPDGRLSVILSTIVFEDAPLTKHRLMGAILHLRNSFLFYDLIGPKIIRRFSPAGEFLKP